MANVREKHLLNAMHSLVLYSGGGASKAINSIKKVAYQGKTATKKRKPFRKLPDTPGAELFRMVSSKNPVTDYSRARTPMAG